MALEGSGSHHVTRENPAGDRACSSVCPVNKDCSHHWSVDQATCEGRDMPRRFRYRSQSRTFGLRLLASLSVMCKEESRVSPTAHRGDTRPHHGACVLPLSQDSLCSLRKEFGFSQALGATECRGPSEVSGTRFLKAWGLMEACWVHGLEPARAPHTPKEAITHPEPTPALPSAHREKDSHQSLLS